ncbi:MAG: DUF2520 domain-containing protein [Eubacterium sp.]|nr:DUF2520 domain-containing protein [Eubacterium sp.]
MKIGFIGAGRVGCTFGKYMKLHGLDVAGYYSRNLEHAREAATFTDTLCYERTDDLVNDCDIIFLTVSDKAIAEVFDGLKGLPIEGKIICHTSGAMTSSVFTDSDSSGVYGYSIHPIYAVSDKLTSYKDFQNAFITIEGHEKYMDTIVAMVDQMGLKHSIINAHDKVKYHASACLASNMVCGIFAMAQRLLTECGFSEEDAHTALSGLFLDNAKGVVSKGAAKQLTGPIERGDAVTVKAHLEALNEDDKNTYTALAAEVLKLARIKNGGEAYEELSRYI